MHYTCEELVSAIWQAGINSGDVVSLQVSLGRIGLPSGVARNIEDVSEFVIDAFLDVLGPRGTLIVPTYTYSIGRGEVYEVEKTPSEIGEFSEVFRKRTSIRSRDPMLATSGFGLEATHILKGLPKTCYGRGSAFHRLRDADAKIVTMGVGLYYATFRHHIEEMAEVPFRFVKNFTGVIREDGKDAIETWEYFAAPRIPNCEPDGMPLVDIMKDYGLVKIGHVGRGQILSIKAREYFEFGCRELRNDPWLTARGPMAPPFELFANEPQYAA